MIEQLKSLGGNEWKQGDYHRIYFNDLPKWAGLELSLYNTGNISSASLDGERISNSQARKISNILDQTKIWYDVPAGRFAFQSHDADLAREIVANIKAELEGVVAA